ncbi:tryptophan synthase subunit alpha [Kitasatospora sp. MAA19]|uniref:tryptophan synthase subunit alpha n=1 Tax=Kitasatospora sp. MAA19 TaxID=3035090 RepID=UPI00247624FF|nr:tryptophan synthase subunit alpha [Kitasatospora sp. MAA19]
MPDTALLAPRADGRPGLALFLNAGDPPQRLTDLALMLDEEGTDVLELAVPFPNSPTDGPVIRRSAARALAAGTTLDTVLAELADLRPRLRHLKIALLADWSHSLRHRDPGACARAIAAAGADALLVHALPPRLRPAWRRACHEAALPQVATCYPTSGPEVIADAATAAHGAYVYLVAHYGRSGTAPAAGHHTLAATVAALRAAAPATPVAVGFGVRSAADLDAVAAAGADAAIVGSAAVARIETALTEGRDAVQALRALLHDLRPPAPPRPGPAGRTTRTGTARTTGTGTTAGAAALTP